MKQAINNSASLLKSPFGGFRRLYTSPRIEIILLDNEISLALQSAPPGGPGEGAFLNSRYKDNNPFNQTFDV